MGSAWRWLMIASLAETASLPVLILNRLTAHWPIITSTLGPVHGLAYLAVIALALATSSPGRVKALALIPAIGGIAFITQHRRTRCRHATIEPDDTPALNGDKPCPDQAL